MNQDIITKLIQCLGIKMGKLWLLCEKCAEKADELKRELTDKEMCPKCRKGVN